MAEQAHSHRPPVSSSQARREHKLRQRERAKRAKALTLPLLKYFPMPVPQLESRLSLGDFLITPGFTGEPTPRTGSRSEFFRNLGLEEKCFPHRYLYDDMKKEVKRGMERLFSTRDSLRPEFAANLTVQPPYGLHQISEPAFLRQVGAIYRRARRRTRGVFELVQVPGEPDNWVISWLLCRVIKTRWNNTYGRLHESEAVEAPAASTSPVDTDVSNVTAPTTQHSGSMWSGHSSPATSVSEADSVDILLTRLQQDAKFEKDNPPPGYKRPRKRYWDPIYDG